MFWHQRITLCQLGSLKWNWHILSFYQTSNSFSLAFVQFLSLVRLFCDPVNCSPPGSTLHGSSQARILEWVATSFSRGSSQPRYPTNISCIGRQILYHWDTREFLLFLLHEGKTFVKSPLLRCTRQNLFIITFLSRNLDSKATGLFIMRS